MKRVHISLIGGQGAPVYNFIKADKENIDVVVLVCSKQSENVCKTIEKLVKKNLQLEVKTKELAPNNIDEIYKGIRALQKDYGTDEITLNVSGGTKPWSILFYSEFSKNASHKIYFIDQNNNVWDLKNGGHASIPALTIDEMFALANLKIEKTGIDEFTEADVQNIAPIKEIRSRYPKAYRDIVDAYKKAPTGKTTYAKDDTSFAVWDKATRTFHCHFEKYNRQKEYKLSSPHIWQLFINTGWFELEVAKLVSQWRSAKVIWTNCEIKDEKGSTLNEIDIIVFNGTKYLFIECKTQVHSITDVDKFNNLKSYSGLSIKRVFITEVKMTDKAARKCKENDISYFSMEEISKKGEKWFFGQLDNIMIATNKK